MPLKEKRSLSRGKQLLIWELEESEDFFRSKLDLADWEKEKVAKMRGRRSTEWLAGRWLIHFATEQQQRVACNIDEYGKPHLANKQFELSLSHSHDLVGVLTGNQSLGLDIQKLVAKIERIAHKFMREEEMASLVDRTRLEHLHVYWGAKEALYKAYGRKALDFRKHIHIFPFEYKGKGETVGCVRLKEEWQEFFISYERMGDYMLVVAENY